DATPAPVSSRPTIVRPADDPEVSTARSRRAAIGRARLARMAGAIAETTLTPAPTTNAVTTVAVDTMTLPFGRSRPPALSMARSAYDSPIPPARPAAAETTPTD